MLKTVSVPEQIAPIFRDAEEKVRSFFEHLNADPSHGSIDIQGSRYILVRGAAFSVEFFLLVRKIFGEEHTKDADLFSAGLLYELAHAVGESDAKDFHRKMSLKDPIAKLSAGPVHFSHSGWAFVEVLEESTPTPDEDYYLVYKHPYSFECDAWINSEVDAGHPVCIMNAGYSSGWCQESFGIPLDAREITCRSMGHDDCLFIMAQPHLIEEKIQAFLDKHPEITVSDSELAFVNSKQLGSLKVLQEEAHKGPLQERLFAYARSLEATRNQLSDKVTQLNDEILERKRIESELQESEKRWRELIDATFDAIIICEDEIIVDTNRASENLFRIETNEILGSSIKELFNEENFLKIRLAIQQYDKELLDLKLFQNNKELFIDIQIHHVRNESKQAVILAIRDVTERSIAMQRLERLANFDALTGLPNRTMFQRVVNRSLLSSNFSSKHGLLFLDLDNFKQINDNFGHSAGDHLLYELGNRIVETTRGGNTICRLGGDEFAIWIPDMDCDEDASHVAHQIIESLRTVFNINREKIRVSFSIGIAVYPHDGTDYSSLTRNSDIAMYSAKKAGKNRYCFYSDTKDRHSSR